MRKKKPVEGIMPMEGRKKATERHEDCADLLPAGSGKLTDEHRSLWSTVKKRFSEGLEKGDEKELKLVKIAGDALLDIVKGEKEAWGLTGDDSGKSREEIYGVAAEMEIVTVSSAAGKAVDGG